MSGKLSNSYAVKINKICNYIGEHLDEDLTVERLSQIANFSKFHFHRQFFAYTGINVGRFILMMRLKRASYQLVFKKCYRIIDIAFDANFENPESFSRAFKTAFGQTPSQFRQKPKWERWNDKFEFSNLMRSGIMNVEICEFKETKVAVLEHRGSHNLLNDSVSLFIEWRKTSKLSPVAMSNTYGLAYDDPQTTEPDKFRFDICGSVKVDVPENAQGILTKIIPGGRCARARHLGSHEDIGQTTHYLYSEWLPNSGFDLRDFPCYFHYINFFPEVPEHKLITDIYLPLK